MPKSLGQLMTETIANINSMEIHVCAANEYDSTTLVPTIEHPNEHTFYLVPDGSSTDLYTEWVRIGSSWEKFGAARVDLSGKADKNNPVFTGTINMGRNTYSTIGTNSITLGKNITAAGELSYAEGNGDIYDTKTIGNTTYTGSGAYGSYSHAEGEMTWAIGYASHAEGGRTQATNRFSHAEGSNTTASSDGAHAEGVSTTASGSSSHAEGAGVTASGDYSHAEGQGGAYTVGGTTYTSDAQGPADHIEGIQTRTAGSQGGNHAEGCRTAAIGGASHSEGRNTIASGLYSHAEGNLTTASGESAHAEGIGGTFSYKGVSYTSGATGNQSHSEGYQTVASGNDSHAEGSQTQAIAIHSHAEGANTLASGQVSHAEGSETQANGTSSHAEGTSSNAAGSGSHAEGQGTLASGMSSHAEGYGGTYNMNNSTYTSAAVGMADHIEGYQTRTASGQPGNHAEGYQTAATGGASHSEGTSTTASGNSSHAEGAGTQATGAQSHAEGGGTIASGHSSHAEGYGTTASGVYSHAEGSSTITIAKASHVEGIYNIQDNYDTWTEWTATTEYEAGDKVKVTTVANDVTTVKGYICQTAHTSGATFATTNWNSDEKYNFAHIVGNGTADNARSNAYALDWDGNGHFKGNVYVGANADSTGGNKLATEAYVTSALANAGGSVSDVQIDGTSILSSGVANIPMASYQNKGVVKVSSDYGITLNNNGYLTFNTGNDPTTKLGGSYTHAVLVGSQHVSTFYGLAKVAGVDLAQSGVDADEEIGHYSETAKAAIRTLIGAGTYSKPSGGIPAADLAETYLTSHQDISGKLDVSLKGANNGLAELDANGKIPTNQLPASIDEILEYSTLSAFPASGQTGKIYFAQDSNKTYRWSGTTYVEISASLVLGTTSSTAFRGDYGDAAYTHAVTNKGTAYASGLYKITTNAEGHVTAATAVTKTDITALDIPGQDTTYSNATTSIAGLMSAEDKTKLDEFDASDYATKNYVGEKHREMEMFLKIDEISGLSEQDGYDLCEAIFNDYTMGGE